MYLGHIILFTFERILSMSIIYFCVALLATILGSMAGLGGGVIIKPVLDFLGHYDINTIGLLSSFTVFAMAVVAIMKQFQHKFKVNLKSTISIALGSIAGGNLGQSLLEKIILITNENLVQIVQAIFLVLLLTFVILYMNNTEKFKNYHVKNPILCFTLGLILGSLAAFLGIGGGPINVAFLTIFFSMEAKEAAVNSVLIILFSQASKILTIASGTGFSSYDLSMLYFMIPAGVIGGFIGSKLNLIASNKVIIRVFNIVVLCVIFLNIWNASSSIYNLL